MEFVIKTEVLEKWKICRKEVKARRGFFWYGLGQKGVGVAVTGLRPV
jgi:hypothetical protein